MTTIKKADGTIENFNETKLRRSLRRSGASKKEVDVITAKVMSELYDGIRTQEIYSKAFKYMRENEVPKAARYSLRRALFGLGPTGFPFEKFLAKMFEHEGYTTRTGVIMQGKCAQHEIDVAAYKADHSFVAEAKFHARPGIKTDLQVAMYSFARKLDLVEQKICQEDICGVKDLWIITNTKFTSAAEHYSECSDITLLSWNYPVHNNLHDRIQATGLYPITVLQSLSASQKKLLLDRNVIVCSDIVARPHLLKPAHLSKQKTEAVLSEARQLSHEPKNLL